MDDVGVLSCTGAGLFHYFVGIDVFPVFLGIRPTFQTIRGTIGLLVINDNSIDIDRLFQINGQPMTPTDWTAGHVHSCLPSIFDPIFLCRGCHCGGWC